MPFLDDLLLREKELEKQIGDVRDVKTELRAVRKLIALKGGQSSDGKVLLCGICNRSFQSSQGLGTHKRKIHGIRGQGRQTHPNRETKAGDGK